MRHNPGSIAPSSPPDCLQLTIYSTKSAPLVTSRAAGPFFRSMAGFMQPGRRFAEVVGGWQQGASPAPSFGSRTSSRVVHPVSVASGVSRPVLGACALARACVAAWTRSRRRARACCFLLQRNNVETDMNGALMKAASRFTIAAAFGLVLGVSSAQAADLGGNCCADLEERIADLEATTARKGNRKMSLTITGQVHRMTLWYDDGHRSDTYWGLDNTNSSSRFSFTGTAKVTPAVSVGFDITIEIEAGGTSSKVSQFDEDGKLGAQINGGFGASFNAANSDAYFGDARRVAWWIEDTRWGRLTVGRYESAGAITTIDLAGIGAGASASVILVNGGFLVRGPQAQYWGVSFANLGDPAANQGRTELLRWDSPTYQGFILSASIAEFNSDYWGVMLRYANEFNGVRVAAGIGYENATDKFTSVAGLAGPNDLLGPDGEVKAWGAGLSVLHVPSGLFAQGHYLAADFSCLTGNPNTAAFGNAPNGSQTGYWGQSTDCRKDANQWLIQAGITKNWFGFGNTAIFVE